jgi:hypothetical protein
MHIFDLWIRPGMAEMMILPHLSHLPYPPPPKMLYGCSPINSMMHVFDLWTHPSYSLYQSSPSTLYGDPMTNFRQWWRLSYMEDHHPYIQK